MYLRGVELEKLDRMDEALTAYEAALAEGCDEAGALAAVGSKLHQSNEGGQRERGLQMLQRALAKRPKDQAIMNRLGRAYHELGQSVEAAKLYRQACKLWPAAPHPRNNLGVVLQEMGDLSGAIEVFEELARMCPDYVEGHWNLALALLARGQWRRGWLEFEWRRRLATDALEKNRPAQPEWDGRSLDGLRVLVRAEQGIGDTIQFARYLPLLKERGARELILECQPGLAALLRRADGVDRAIERGQPRGAFDVHARLMSLPGILGKVDPEAMGKYIHPDPQRLSTWHPRLEGMAGFKIGIAWQGNPQFPGDRSRSIPLAHFEPLARLEGVRLIALQAGFGIEQIEQVKDRFIVEKLPAGVDSASAGAMIDTAAIIQHLDLVITSDTSIAHLCGAVGVPVWVALGHAPDWRWGTEGERSEWYSSMRLFRQQRPGDWDAVFTRMASELAPRLGQSPPVVNVLAPMSPGELIDRITILRLKTQRIGDPEKLARVRAEIESLGREAGRSIAPSPRLDELTARLMEANEALWEVEDEIRACKAAGQFDGKFVALARAVYLTNDQRGAIKRKIDQLLGASWSDEKSYESAALAV